MTTCTITEQADNLLASYNSPTSSGTLDSTIVSSADSSTGRNSKVESRIWAFGQFNQSALSTYIRLQALLVDEEEVVCL